MIYITLFTTLLTVKMLGFQCSYRGPWQLRLRQPERPGPRYKLKKISWINGFTTKYLAVLLFCAILYMYSLTLQNCINYFNLIVC